MEGPKDPALNGRNAVERFDTTHWSVIFEAGRRGTEQAPAALERLCRQYWQPLCGFARRKGYGPEDAEDLTQSFFGQFIRKALAGAADPARGRFRTFLLTSFERFLIGEWKKAHALKRNGAPPDTPQEENGSDAALFDRAWAEGTFAAALARLRLEYEQAGQSSAFAQLRKYLSQTGHRDDYAHTAMELGIKPDSVAVAVHRLRRRYSELVRAEVTRTVATPEEVDAELKYLVDIMAR